jgi:hypothetical protein
VCRIVACSADRGLVPGEGIAARHFGGKELAEPGPVEVAAVLRRGRDCRQMWRCAWRAIVAYFRKPLVDSSASEWE